MFCSGEKNNMFASSKHESKQKANAFRRRCTIPADMHVNKTTKEEHISALILGENKTKQKNKMENKYATVNNHKEKILCIVTKC